MAGLSSTGWLTSWCCKHFAFALLQRKRFMGSCCILRSPLGRRSCTQSAGDWYRLIGACSWSLDARPWHASCLSPVPESTPWGRCQAQPARVHLLQCFIASRACVRASCACVLIPWGHACCCLRSVAEPPAAARLPAWQTALRGIGMHLQLITYALRRASYQAACVQQCLFAGQRCVWIKNK